jgi:cytochrome c peroxidase
MLIGAVLALSGCGGGADPTPSAAQAVLQPAVILEAPAPAAPPAPAPAPAPAPGTPPPAAPDSSPWPWALPAGWLAPKVPLDNPLSDAKAELGRHLFFEERLSGNGLVSCGTCHQQQFGFGDARVTPFGSTGQRLARNSQPLANIAWLSPLGWANQSTATLEQQMHGPLFATQPVEMGVDDGNRAAVLARIAADTNYSRMFGEVFPAEAQPVTWDNLIRAIAAFQRTMVSSNARVDQAERGEIAFTPAELRGQQLYFSTRTNCSACHGGKTFAEPTSSGGVPVTSAFHNIGLYNVGNTGAYPTGNRGLFERSGVAADMGRFRTPSLRNLTATAPYMHDGSVATLVDVIELYAAGGRDVSAGPQAGDGRANPFKSPLIVPLDLSADEKSDLLAFLRTLTDDGFLADPKFANPFAPR